MRRLLAVARDLTGNLPPLLDLLPDQLAPTDESSDSSTHEPADHDSADKERCSHHCIWQKVWNAAPPRSEGGDLSSRHHRGFRQKLICSDFGQAEAQSPARGVAACLLLVTRARQSMVRIDRFPKNRRATTAINTHPAKTAVTNPTVPRPSMLLQAVTSMPAYSSAWHVQDPNPVII